MAANNRPRIKYIPINFCNIITVFGAPISLAGVKIKSKRDPRKRKVTRLTYDGGGEQPDDLRLLQ